MARFISCAMSVLDHSQTRRARPLAPASGLVHLHCSGPLCAAGRRYPRPNVVAEEAYKGFVEYSLMGAPSRRWGLKRRWPRRARGWCPLSAVPAVFAFADDRIGTVEEWEDQEALDRWGTDRG